MILTCVRHGRTDWNRLERFQGQSDIPLDSVGREQAEMLAARLRTEAFDRAVSSDLARAAETARIILAGRAIPLELQPAWREMSFGLWEGLTWPQIGERHPETAADPAASPRAYTGPGGESFEAVCERVASGVRELLADSPTARTLLVTHAGVLHALLRVLDVPEGRDALSFKFTPASLSRFAFHDGRWHTELLNSANGVRAAVP